MNYKKTHSQTLLPMLHEIVSMIDLNLDEIDAIAVAAGPGSFTGLRIGSATAKGLGLALDKPIVSISTVEALAYNLFDTEGLICPIMDARRNQTYTGIYSFENGVFQEIQEPIAIEMDEMIRKLNSLGRKVIFLGDGVPVFRERIQETLQVPYLFAPAHLNKQRAGAVGALACQYYAKGQVERAREHQPYYLRLSQAERERAESVGQIQIRKMLESDVEQVVKIEMDTFTTPWSAQAFLDTLKRTDTIYAVAEEKGKILGYCGLWQSFEEGQISNMAVAKEVRNRGVGRKMLEGLLAFGKEAGMKAFTLEVRESNLAAIHLYESLGFVRAGIRKDFYVKPKENAVIMWKR